MNQYTINAEKVLDGSTLEYLESMDHLSSIDDTVRTHMNSLFELPISKESSPELHKMNVIRQFQDHFDKKDGDHGNEMLNAIHGQDMGRIHSKSPDRVERYKIIQERLFKDFALTENQLIQIFGESYPEWLILEGYLVWNTFITLTQEEADYMRLLMNRNSEIGEYEIYFQAHHSLVQKFS